MDTTTLCIPLAHIQTYFDLRKSIIAQVDWLEKRSQLKFHNPHELLELIIGLNPEQFYQKAGIDYRTNVSHCFISVEQCLSLVDQAISALEMPYLGLAMGNLMTISHHGMAGVAAVTQPNLGRCLETISRFCHELFPPLAMMPRVEGKEGIFAMTENISLAPYSHFFYELNMVSFYNIFLHLVGGEHELSCVDFSYPEPAWGHIYRRYFRCPVRFNQAETCLRGSASLEFYELPLANRLMAMSAEKTLFENIPTRAIRLLPLRLRRLLLRYYGAFPSLEQAASDLGMSGRTLRRKLAEDGTTYQQELDQVREKLAKEYFYRGGTSITQLSIMLGFADSSAFAKAFRRWTGLAPTAFLEQQQMSDISN
ncbi:AraC family transcriptional regulator [Agitococcus lubricus]|uniref:AraC family transcriptional regulator n=1 Tax=Agitococcus lubricus TaxID=1077255 RepID=A0A2T5J2Z5_9GAMM|nr:AraC family transcriptional regulator [Agitococcus lubricus]PTQ90975.1 AraC family transcriptional regulator [Agitococcus lubricus]